jgi:hypothetical protein
VEGDNVRGINSSAAAVVECAVAGGRRM